MEPPVSEPSALQHHNRNGWFWQGTNDRLSLHGHEICTDCRCTTTRTPTGYVQVGFAVVIVGSRGFRHAPRIGHRSERTPAGRTEEHLESMKDMLDFWGTTQPYPMANSSMLALPTMMQPWSSNRCTMVLV